MPSSGPMIPSTRSDKLGFAPADIKPTITVYAHIDDAGVFAEHQQQAPEFAAPAVMRDDVPAMESGDRDDLQGTRTTSSTWCSRSIARRRDGDVIKMGEVLSTAYLTPGHICGAQQRGARDRHQRSRSIVAFPTALVSIGCNRWGATRSSGIAEYFRVINHSHASLTSGCAAQPGTMISKESAKRRRLRRHGALSIQRAIDVSSRRRNGAFEAEGDSELGVAKRRTGFLRRAAPASAVGQDPRVGTVTSSDSFVLRPDWQLRHRRRTTAVFGVLRHRRRRRRSTRRTSSSMLRRHAASVRRVHRGRTVDGHAAGCRPSVPCRRQILKDRRHRRRRRTHRALPDTTGKGGTR